MKTTETITDTTPAITLEYENGFASKQFIEHITAIYCYGQKLSKMFLCKFLEAVIEYGIESKNASKNQLAYFIYDMVPDVEFCEVCAYCSNEILTNNARLEKYDYWGRGTEA